MPGTVQHSVGSWKFDGRTEISAGGEVVAWVRGGVPESDANGHLMAAAPLLLQAIEQLLNDPHSELAVSCAQAAIAHAHGLGQ